MKGGIWRAIVYVILLLKGKRWIDGVLESPNREYLDRL